MDTSKSATIEQPTQTTREHFTLKAGTAVALNGYTVTLAKDTVIDTDPDTWQRMQAIESTASER